ncbi:flocculation protein [Thalictrum thalictroides]|uniref:Flocculation protein n=1 Tax=Thalictrum thalictroides TaxID=46969 RepID=A0A7J6VD34_THATH|nr:flocculation protein [Thalictrum thalictroides]
MIILSCRGNLNLTLLPSSGLRISYVGDDGCIERLATLSCNSESSVLIEEISADKSGRSFLVKLPDGLVSYFWCSEQSKHNGFELVAKMKDLLRRKPSLAQLSGISEPRLDCFATYLRAYLCAAVSCDNVNPSVLSSPAEFDSNFQCPSSSIKFSRFRCINGQAGKPHSVYQGSLSPRSNSFKDGAPRNSSIRSGTREKFKRRGDIHCVFSVIADLPVTSTSVTEAFSTNQTENRKVSDGTLCSFLPLSSLDSAGKSAFPPSSRLPSTRLPSAQISSNASIFSPYYCWCPPCTSALQYTVTPPHLPISSMETVSLPPLSTLLSAAMSSTSLSQPKLPLDLIEVPSLDFPALLPDPMARVPLPVSSFITVSSSQQFPMFTPLMCDPIVHIPIMSVCSAGQGYMVSAGPAISTAVSPLLPSFVNPLIQETESVLEKNARETLHLLLSSTQTNPQLEALPSEFNSMDSKHSLAVGSRGLFCGTSDVETIANSIAAMGLVSMPHAGGDVIRGYSCNHKLDVQIDGSRDLEEYCVLDDDANDSTIINDTRERLDAA